MMETAPLTYLAKKIESGETLTSDDLDAVNAVLDRYPYFTVPAALLLRDAQLDESVRRQLQARIAINAADSATLMALTDPEGRRMAEFYPSEETPVTPSTENALDTFLDQYGSSDPKETELLERLIFNPVPDYSQVLAEQAREEAEGPVSEQDALLDAFLAKQGNAARQAEEKQATEDRQQHRTTMAEAEADAPLSESLAKIYVKQQRYDKAYEIIYQLSLNNPKKSIYFADQLRFLKKLIYIQQARKKK
ncbi:MAG: hypothetical protein NC111_00925 [Bacteroides sp.]|nr:hypothetical protein [Bacteroides sp.]MCM1471081.1 hypothetical protein [Bacteroides sp.]